MEHLLFLAGGGMLGVYVGNTTTPQTGFWAKAFNMLLLCGGVVFISRAGIF